MRYTMMLSDCSAYVLIALQVETSFCVRKTRSNGTNGKSIKNVTSDRHDQTSEMVFGEELHE